VTDQLPTPNLVFIDSHIPGMPDGDYRLTVQQALSITGESTELTPEQAGRYLYLSVAGPRFSLDPSLVKAVFPPDKGVGRYPNVLPHIVFDRSTLPWERRITSETPRDTTWLALLMFVGDEIDQISTQTISVGELQNGSSNPRFPSIGLEVAQSESDQAVVLDAPFSLLYKTLPRPDDLPLLAHVRELTLDGAANTDEANLFPILVCNRLPAVTPPTTGNEVKVFLVSLEGRDDLYDNLQSGNAAADPTMYRLVTLYSWQYTTLPESETFTDYILNAAAPRPGNADNLLRMDLLDGTDDGTTRANSLLSAGFVPLAHQTRQGNHLVSWYRSPFVTGAVSVPEDMSLFAAVRSPDQLARYFSQVGMLDTSYAAAWQLGQLLTLQNTSVSQALYNWKHAQALLASAVSSPHLPLKPLRPLPLPAVVQTWLAQLALFQHVPFNYLVPVEQMLPSESIRFFTVDPLWRAALLDGAFSVGRVVSADADRERPHVQALQESLGSKPISGFLLRSHVVEGWPRLQVEGYDTVPEDENTITVGTPLPMPRMERLAPDILLCLFEGDLQTLELHEVPEMIHFGLGYDPQVEYTACNLGGGTPTGWYKAYRMSGSAELFTDCYVDAGQYVQPSGLVGLRDLAQALAGQGIAVDPAPYADAESHPWWVAYQMIEGVQRVRLFISSK
jgi:hypothetical protein